MSDYVPPNTKNVMTVNNGQMLLIQRGGRWVNCRVEQAQGTSARVYIPSLGQEVWANVRDLRAQES